MIFELAMAALQSGKKDYLTVIDTYE